MTRHLLLTGLTLAVLAAAPGVVRAQTFTPITTWTFNSVPADATTTTGTTAPAVGTGTLTLVGGTTSTFSTGSPGDTTSAGDNSGLNTTTYPAQGTGSGTAGVQFAVSTATFQGPIQISLDFRQSGTASRYFQLQLSTDGVAFANAAGGTAAVGTINAGNTLTTFDNNGLYANNSGSGSQTFVQGLTYTLPAGSVYGNDANFAFRWVAVFDQSNTAPGNYISSNVGTAAAYTTAGTARFDDVSVAAAPEPSTWLMLALGGAGLFVRMRCRAAGAGSVTRSLRKTA